MQKTILLIEDDLVLQQTIVEYLGKSEFKCHCVETLLAARNLVEKFFFDIVLLDLSLPDGDGLEFIDFIKMNWPESGIIIISAREKLEDKITGLNLGADDYLIKPFHFAELNARMNALLRHKNVSNDQIVEFESLKIDLERRQFTIAGEEMELNRKEFDLLVFLIENKGKVLTKESLFEHVWGENSLFMTNSDFIYTQINRLRKKIRSHTGENYIKTVYGFGYKLEVD